MDNRKTIKCGYGTEFTQKKVKAKEGDIDITDDHNCCNEYVLIGHF